MKNKDKINSLLSRRSLGEPLSKEQDMEITEWISTHKEEYEELEMLFKAVDNEEYNYFSANRENAWNKVAYRLSNKKKIRYNTIFAYAASISLLIGIALFWSINSGKELKRYSNISLNRENIILPDSSTIILYPGSTAQFKIKNGERKLSLSGKAYFEVRKNKNAPFIVEASNMRIKVLGTSFLVDVQHKDSAAVYVKTGLVQVDAERQSVKLRVNQQVYITGGKLIKSEIKSQSEVFGVNSEILVFDDTYMSEIIRQVERIYNVKIDMDKQIGKNKISTQIKIENLSNIISELCHICNCKCDTVSENHFNLYE